MKVIYCIAGLYNSGGMERIITEKANYLADHGFDVVIVTAEQRGRPPFYPLHPKVIHTDLGINYSENISIIKKLCSYYNKRKKHKRELSKLLMKEHADFVISTMGNEFFFLYSINDGSKKLAELHFSKSYRILGDRNFPWNIIDKIRTIQENSIARKYNKFIVLTNEDAQNWSKLSNIKVIPNFNTNPNVATDNVTKHRLISVGRLDYQKGYDLLIRSCQLIKSTLANKWEIVIYGNGKLKDELTEMINRYDLSEIIKLHPAISDIESAYLNCDGLLLSSRYEGFPMVLLEAMSYGIPPISFECPCGPRDVITSDVDGLLVPNGCVTQFANAIERFVSDESLRKKLSHNALVKSKMFEKNKIMKQWIDFFNCSIDNL